MNAESVEHEGTKIDLRLEEGQPRVLIDGVPVKWGQLPDGKYFFHDYAYDWSDDLMALAKRYVSYRQRVHDIQSKTARRGGE